MNGFKLFALMLFSFNVCATEQTAKQYIGEIQGQISVDAEGRVTAVYLPNIKESKLKVFMSEQISTWKFTPMKVNGKPVESNNDFGFELTIYTYKDKKLNQISFDHVFVSPTKLELEQHSKYKDSSKRVEPMYPYEALRQGLEASLDIAVKIEPDGSISETGIYKMKLLNPNPGIGEKDQRFALNMFGKSAMKAVKQWKFSREALELNECSMGCISQISITYNLANAPVTYNLNNIQLKMYREIPVAALPWFETNKVKKIQDKPESQFVRLKSELSEQPIDIGG
jgi:hypothetical protein